MAASSTVAWRGSRLTAELARTRVRPIELAQALGVSRGQVNHWQSGRRPMTTKQSDAAAAFITSADRTARLLTALQARPLTSPEAVAAVPGLRRSDLDALTGPDGPVQWALETRVDRLGRHRTHQVLLRREQTAAGLARLTADELRGLQLLTGVSTADVAAFLEVTDVAVQQWRRGERAVPPGRAEQLLDWLLPAGVQASGRLREAATEVGLSQAQLAHAVHVSPGTLSTWVTGARGRRLPLEQVLAVARALDAVARQHRPSERERARAQLLEVLGLAGRRGMGKVALLQAAQAGRDHLERVPGDVRVAELERLCRQGLVEQVPVMVASKSASQRPTAGYRLAGSPGRPQQFTPMTAEELNQRLAAGDLTPAQMAAHLGVTSSAVSRWRRTGPDVAWASRIRELLPAVEVQDPLLRARTALLAALEGGSGGRAEVLAAAGYGRHHPVAGVALAQLLEEDLVHWQLTPSTTGRPSRQLQAGPDPHGTLTGDQLRAAREARGLSGAALAQALAVSPAAVSLWESAGSRPVPAARVAALRAALGA